MCVYFTELQYISLNGAYFLLGSWHIAFEKQLSDFYGNHTQSMIYISQPHTVADTPDHRWRMNPSRSFTTFLISPHSWSCSVFSFTLSHSFSFPSPLSFSHQVWCIPSKHSEHTLLCGPPSWEIRWLGRCLWCLFLHSCLSGVWRGLSQPLQRPIVQHFKKNVVILTVSASARLSLEDLLDEIR